MTDPIPLVFSPGSFLADELEARGWSHAFFADRIGRHADFLTDFLDGMAPMGAHFAKVLGDATGTSAQFWLNLEAAYRFGEPDPTVVTLTQTNP